ncbi:MAG TPA: hypothetical protein VFL57_05870 [Bryobacteraceae bacterium]|nr:hypothetical protein [Bryobacteraceae bacterium]
MQSKFLWVAVAVGVAVSAYAGLDGSYVLPVDHEAIQYSKLPSSDAVSRLQTRLAEKRTTLEYHPDFGYLPSVLKQLGVPVSSQVLVFSRTSFQASRISPKNPRALYFNDELAVGYVRGGDVLELAAADPRLGVVFYTLDQENTVAPAFKRQDSCLQCHASGSTLGVPGLVVRSVYPDRTGMPIFHAGSFVTDHRSKLEQRWGGWYVTGTHGEQRHLGNRIFRDAADAKAPDAEGLNRKTLDGLIDSGLWLEPHSDIVALMVLEHQTRMQNLITRVGWEVRMALHQAEALNKALGEPPGTMSDTLMKRINNLAEELVRHMLFTDEAPLTGPVAGTSRFAEEYLSVGPRDRRGRSLREFDLKRRLFRYPCSPLVYSAAYRNLPPVVLEHVRRRLAQVLSGQDESPAFARLSTDDRTAIREILTDTKVLARQ